MHCPANVVPADDVVMQFELCRTHDAGIPLQVVFLPVTSVGQSNVFVYKVQLPDASKVLQTEFDWVQPCVRSGLHVSICSKSQT